MSFGDAIGDADRSDQGRAGRRAAVGAFHALIRLDALLEDPDDPAGPPQVASPPACIAADDLVGLVRTVGADVELVTAPHPDAPLAAEGAGWLLRWGRQLDVRVIRDAATAGRLSDGTPVDDLDVASYLAKYATKATEAVGLLAHRLTPATVGRYADPTTHVGRLIAAAWRLGRPEALAPLDEHGRAPYDRLRKWTHMLGFGGHFLTKSRAYSTTFTERRGKRARWRRQARLRQLCELRPDLAGVLDDLADDHDDQAVPHRRRVALRRQRLAVRRRPAPSPTPQPHTPREYRDLVREELRCA